MISIGFVEADRPPVRTGSIPRFFHYEVNQPEDVPEEREPIEIKIMVREPASKEIPGE
ncbi:MAG: hypothetical protein WBM35_01075 [Candidatus Electrothrix sp.]